MVPNTSESERVVRVRRQPASDAGCSFEIAAPGCSCSEVRAMPGLLQLPYNLVANNLQLQNAYAEPCWEGGYVAKLSEMLSADSSPPAPHSTSVAALPVGGQLTELVVGEEAIRPHPAGIGAIAAPRRKLLHRLRKDTALRARHQEFPAALIPKNGNKVVLLLEIDEQADRLAVSAAARQLGRIERVEAAVGGEDEALRGGLSGEREFQSVVGLEGDP